MISKIEVVPVRQAFPHEALHFSKWLEENIDALSSRLELQLTVIEREKAVGSFRLDLLCEDANGQRVIIENQLEQTNHDHLGKLLTYMINLEAKTAIWIATELRPEHERVIDWLNQTTGMDMAFYLVKVEAIRIADSPYAPLFTVMVHPDEQSREIGEEKKEFAERPSLYELFWSQLLERSKGKTNLGLNRTPSTRHWFSVATGKANVTYNYYVLKDHAAIALYIDSGGQTRNKAIFDELYAQKNLIEAEFGLELEWMRLDDKRASRIRKQYWDSGSLVNQDSWPSLQDLMIGEMIRFDKVLRPFIARIKE